MNLKRFRVLFRKTIFAPLVGLVSSIILSVYCLDINPTAINRMVTLIWLALGDISGLSLIFLNLGKS